MKKALALAIAAVMSLSVSGTTLAAPDNPFVDVPANHWAYDAIKQLAKSGAVDGYGDGTFRGDRTLTRYEMAAVIAKISMPAVDGKEGELLRRLQSEFANELYNLGVRVDALEKGASTIKFNGSSRIRYRVGMSGGAAAMAGDGDSNGSHFNQRTNLVMRAKVNENVDFIGVMSVANNSNLKVDSATADPKISNQTGFWMDRAEFIWKSGNFNLHAGRIANTVGTGAIWDEASDGVVAAYKFNDKVRLSTGYVDLAGKNGTVGNGRSMNAFIGDIRVNAGERLSFAAGYLDIINPENIAIANNPDGYTFEQWSVGGTLKLSDNFKIRADYLENMDAPEGSQDKAAWARLQWKEIKWREKGSYMLFADYVKLGNWAIDSSTGGHGITKTIVGNILGGNGLGRDGAEGWGLGGLYMLDKNINLEAYYYKLKAFNGDFDYKDTYSVSATFLF